MSGFRGAGMQQTGLGVVTVARMRVCHACSSQTSLTCVCRTPPGTGTQPSCPAPCSDHQETQLGSGEQQRLLVQASPSPHPPGSPLSPGAKGGLHSSSSGDSLAGKVWPYKDSSQWSSWKGGSSGQAPRRRRWRPHVPWGKLTTLLLLLAGAAGRLACPHACSLPVDRGLAVCLHCLVPANVPLSLSKAHRQPSLLPLPTLATVLLPGAMHVCHPSPVCGCTPCL